MEENNVRVRYRSAFSLHLSHLHQLFAPDILYGPSSSLSSCTHCCNRLLEIGETNRAKFPIDSVYGPPKLLSPKRHMSSAHVTTKDNVIIRKNIIIYNILLFYRI